jgi:hypothetical protein
MDEFRFDDSLETFTVMARDTVSYSVGQIETFPMLSKKIDDPQGIQFMFESFEPPFFHEIGKDPFPYMPEGCMSQIMPHPDCPS